MSAPPIAAVLGVDEAARSGWGIALGRQVLHSGAAETATERREAVARAIACAGGDARRLLVVFEDHSKFSKDYRAKFEFGPRGERRVPRDPILMANALGVALGRWYEQLDLLGHPTTLRVLVTPVAWRARMGIPLDDTDKVRSREWASQHLGRSVTDPDEGDGVCITAFGAIDGIARNDHRLQQKRLYARGKREERRQLELDPAASRASTRRPA